MSFSVYLWYVLAPVLVAAHTVNNLDLGDEQGLENEGYQSDEKIFFSEYFVSAAQTQKELSPAMPFVRYGHHHLRAYFDPPPGLKALIKWVICLKMYFGISSGRYATRKFCRVGGHFFLFLAVLKQGICDETVARSPNMLCP